MRDKTLALFYLRNYFGLKEIYLPSSRDPARVLGLMAEAAERCRRCPLGQKRNRNVFGWGNPYARLMLVGEAPGGDEDRLGKPFVGKAGKVLTQLLERAGIDREKDLYITNVVKCRPPGNRDPLPSEIRTCFRFLKLQVESIKPELIVCLGRWSARTLLGLPQDERFSLGSLRGRFHTNIFGIPTLITYHPSYVARNEKNQELWQGVANDFVRAKEFLGF